MLYFTADMHFFDQKMVYSPFFAKRMFLNVAQMNRTMINNWKQTVTDDDVIYHLGDLALIPSKKAAYQQLFMILQQLPGRIVLIKGNHDSRALFRYLAKHNYQFINGDFKFTFHDVGCLLKFAHQQFFLTHYPMMLGKGGNRINLHGHIHHASCNTVNNINVGVDSPEKEYLAAPPLFGAPFSQKQVLEMVDKKRQDFQKMQF